eukprot:9509728-Karenia_brevis.AAC.1
MGRLMDSTNDDEEEDECDDAHIPPVVELSDEEANGGLSIEELKEMKVVSRRKRRFERNKESSKVDPTSWKKDPQKMILGFQVAEVSKPLLAVKRTVEK